MNREVQNGEIEYGDVTFTYDMIVVEGCAGDYYTPPTPTEYELYGLYINGMNLIDLLNESVVDSIEAQIIEQL